MAGPRQQASSSRWVSAPTAADDESRMLGCSGQGSIKDLATNYGVGLRQ